MNKYQIVLDSGEVEYVIAETKAEAHKKFSMFTGMTQAYLKKHCVTRNMGKVSGNEGKLQAYIKKSAEREAR